MDADDDLAPPITERSSAAVAITTIDYHTGGEPFRIVADVPVPMPGSTVAERRARAMADGGSGLDDLRRLLCFEPRGHADMYGGFITPPDDTGAHFGVLFWHADGFSTACGHGTIALGAWAVRSGRVPARPGAMTEVVIDVPSGRVRALVTTDGDGRVGEVTFVNVPSALIAAGVEVDTGRETVTVDLGWGGALYACVDAASVGLEIVPDNLDRLIALGRRVKAALADDARTVHPTDPRLSGVYGTIFHHDLASLPDGALHQRNVTVFADGQVDRSPCGSGTAARLAILDAAGVVGPGGSLVHESIVGSRFVGRVAERVTEHGRAAIVAMITGTAHPVGTSNFVVDPDDPLVPGFTLR